MVPLLLRSQATRRSNRRGACRCDRRREKTARRIAWGAILFRSARVEVSACSDGDVANYRATKATVNRTESTSAHARASRLTARGRDLDFRSIVVDPRLRAMSAVARSDISEICKAWKEANLAPLWENARAHRPPPLPEAAYLWSWDKIRPLISAAIDVASPEVVERRVLQLVPPVAKHQDEQQTSSTLSANIQILLPGEKARPHRHTMNALRFVLEGSGATTIVDGKPCPMEEGDLILTPSWTWHEHVHEGDAPIVWLDALDVPFQRYMGTGAFEPGPVVDMPETVADAAF